LAGRLVAAGYTDVTVADISSAAMEQAPVELGAAAKQVTWIEADVRFTTSRAVLICGTTARCFTSWSIQRIGIDT
jgi:hypothetical protein